MNELIEQKPLTFFERHQADERTKRIIEGFHADMQYGGGEYNLSRLPQPNERQALVERNRQLTSLLRPIHMAAAEMDTARQRIAQLLGGYFHLKVDADEQTAGMVADMKDLPLWAIVKACDDVRDGHCYDMKDGKKIVIGRDYPPSVPRLVAQAKSHMQPFTDEKTRVGLILSVTRTRRPDPALAPKAIKEGLVQATKSALKGMNSDFDAALKKQSEIGARRRAEMDAKAKDTAEKSMLALYAQRGIRPVYGAFGIVHPDMVKNPTPVGAEADGEDD